MVQDNNKQPKNNDGVIDIEVNKEEKDFSELIEKAKNSTGFLITVSYYSDEKNDNINHSWVTKNYAKKDIVPSMEHLKEDIESKEVLGVGKKWS